MKKITKILGCVLGLAFLLTGCATVSGIKTKNTELIYNGNSAVMIDGYLYYANAFVDSSAFQNDKDYKKGAANSYLARLNTNVELAAKTNDYSPKKVEKVTSEVTGYANNFMFILGQYIYYATPNRQKGTENGTVSNYYNYTCIYRSKLNGDKKSKVYTTTAEIQEIQVLEFEGKYYIVIYDGTNLIKIGIGGASGVTIIEKDVTSVAMPKTYEKNKVGSSKDWNGYIYYTTTRSDEDNTDVTGTDIKRVKLTENEGEKIKGTSETIRFVDRENDYLFYTLDSTTYCLDVENNTSKNIFDDDTIKTLFYNGTVSNVTLVRSENLEYGFLFKNSSGAYMYKTKSGAASKLNLNDVSETDYKVMLVSGTVMFVATSTSIYRADLASSNNGNVDDCQLVVAMTKGIYKDSDAVLYAYDGTYIYYYAQLEDLAEDEEDDDSTEDAETETDENYYLYRTRADVNQNNPIEKPYQLLSLTQIKSRRTV